MDTAQVRELRSAARNAEPERYTSLQPAPLDGPPPLHSAQRPTGLRVRWWADTVAPHGSAAPAARTPRYHAPAQKPEHDAPGGGSEPEPGRPWVPSRLALLLAPAAERSAPPSENPAGRGRCRRRRL